MTIDPLCFLFMIEAIVLLAVGLGYVYYRYGRLVRQQHVAERPEKGDHSELIQMLNEGIAEREKSQQTDREGEEGLAIYLGGRMAELHLDLMRKTLDGLLSEGGKSLDSLGSWICEGFPVAASERLEGIERYLEASRLTQGITESQEPVGEEENMGESDEAGDGSVDRLPDPPAEGPSDAGKDAERIFVRETTTAQATFAKMRDQFSSVVGYNNQLREQLDKLREEKAGSKEYADLLTQNIEQVEGLIRELEQSNRELNLCVSTLESANDDLTHQIANLMSKQREEAPSAQGEDSGLECGEEGFREVTGKQEEETREPSPPASPPPAGEGDLEALKKNLELVEEEYMNVYTELSPLRDPAQAKPIEEYDAETQKKILSLEEKLSEKERRIGELQSRIDSIEVRQATEAGERGHEKASREEEPSRSDADELAKAV
jgi:hypothetical protein